MTSLAPIAYAKIGGFLFVLETGLNSIAHYIFNILTSSCFFFIGNESVSIPRTKKTKEQNEVIYNQE